LTQNEYPEANPMEKGDKKRVKRDRGKEIRDQENVTFIQTTNPYSPIPCPWYFNGDGGPRINIESYAGNNLGLWGEGLLPTCGKVL
jgi:hypothetical protein